jgi:DnaK suppressor protein
MDPKKREKFRNKLLELRAQVINRGTARLSEALKMSQDDLADETDHAAAVIQQNVSLAVQERDRWLMVEIEHALMKFEDGSYGLCEDSEEPIDEGRLEAQPWTRYSVEAAEVREKRAKRFASNSG